MQKKSLIRNKEMALGILDIFILPYSSISVILGEQQIGDIMSWWIGKFVGRAGFEPA